MTPILAASEVEIVIGIIVFVIWVLGALANKLKGSPRPQRQPGEPSPLERMQREIAEQIERAHGYQAPPPPPLPPPVQVAQREKLQWAEVPPQRQAKQRQPKKPKPTS